MSGRLTKVQRALLDEMEHGPIYWLPPGQKRAARNLTAKGLAKHKPETRELYDEWSITQKGRKALEAGRG